MADDEKRNQTQPKYDTEEIVPVAYGDTVLDRNIYDIEAAIIKEVAMKKYASLVIEKGNTILGNYRIESDAIESPMGKVWRAHHNGWNVDLAMKQPKAQMFWNQKEKDDFIRECEPWTNLGSHPHIVACHYVREIGGIPTIFSEWMDGGSLKDIIKDGSLYDERAAERILDIAIQFARGLLYGHGQGLIHQTVSPYNLLFTKNGVAKVADFGIANARSSLGKPDVEMRYDTFMFLMGGFKEAYCSVEQMHSRKMLTQRTDIYSWAVSVMEMYVGECCWAHDCRNYGKMAGEECVSYLAKARVSVPEAMRELLKECLREDEAQRPHDFAEVEKKLLKIYKKETGNEYSLDIT